MRVFRFSYINPYFTLILCSFSSNGVQPDYKDIARSRKLIEAQLRAYIGRNTPLNEAGFYVNIYPIDPVMLRAVEVLKTQNDHD